jgi:hypothetical protein
MRSSGQSLARWNKAAFHASDTRRRNAERLL